MKCLLVCSCHVEHPFLKSWIHCFICIFLCFIVLFLARSLSYIESSNFLIIINVEFQESCHLDSGDRGKQDFFCVTMFTEKRSERERVVTDHGHAIPVVSLTHSVNLRDQNGLLQTSRAKVTRPNLRDQFSHELITKCIYVYILPPFLNIRCFTLSWHTLIQTCFSMQIHVNLTLKQVYLHVGQKRLKHLIFRNGGSIF